MVIGHFASVVAFLFALHPVHAEQPSAGRVKPTKATPGSVQVSFLPPPLADAVYSVGIYDSKTGRLIRRLHESAPDEAFTAGLNGFITHWDRKDDHGKTVPAGKYTARGWAVGEKLEVKGADVIGNGWVDEDEDLRIRRILTFTVVEADDGLIATAEMADGQVHLLRFLGDGSLAWRRPVDFPTVASDLISSGDDDSGNIYLGEKTAVEFDLKDGHEIRRSDSGGNSITENPLWRQECEGSNHTVWVARPDGLFQLNQDKFYELAQNSPERLQKLSSDEFRTEALRVLSIEPGQPAPRLVRASHKSSRLYLLEESPGWQRVRGLEWSEAKQENGQPVSEWKTFFERSIRRPDPALGLDDPTVAKAPSPVVELPLIRNPLEPGKRQLARLRAGFDEKGSYLETHDGLRLRQVSERPNLRAVKLVKAKAAAGALTFYQTDGAAWDEFALSGVPASLMAFDAGEFELTATGEKRLEGAATEPRDL